MTQTPRPVLEALEAGEVAEGFEKASWTVDVVPVIQREVYAIGAERPDVEFEIEAPLEDWAYCEGVFEPTIRALLRSAGDRAAGPDPTVCVTIHVDDPDRVRVEVSVPGVSFGERERALLTEDLVDPEDQAELSLWLVGWGIDRLRGSVTVHVDDDGTTISLDVPRADEEGKWRADD